jgi:aldose sugar dehydrogenase
MSRPVIVTVLLIAAALTCGFTPQLKHPWAFEVLAPDKFLVTQSTGELILIHNDRQEKVRSVPPVYLPAYGGLLDVAVDEDGTVYLSYLHGDATASTMRVLRARLRDGALIHKRVIFESSPMQAVNVSLGGRLALAPGFVFVTVGDRGDAARAQDLSNHQGKIIRIRADGSGSEIWSYGHRNPQGLAFDTHGRLWEHEHGPWGGDEVNLIKRGINYGWPLATYGIDYSGIPFRNNDPKRFEQPIYYWPSGQSLAPGSLVAETLGDMTRLWIGTRIVTQMVLVLDIKDGHVVREHRRWQGELGLIRDLALHDGWLYILSDYPPAIHKKRP